jgi:hypothetical protein
MQPRQQRLQSAPVRQAPTGVGRVGAGLARLVRLLTAVVLMGTALLVVALVGQGVAGARELPTAAPSGWRELPARPALVPATPAGATFAHRWTTARGLVADRWGTSVPPAVQAVAAAGAAWPAGPPGQPGTGRGRTPSPEWWLAQRPEEPTVQDQPAEHRRGRDGSPPGTVPAAGPERGSPATDRPGAEMSRREQALEGLYRDMVGLYRQVEDAEKRSHDPGPSTVHGQLADTKAKINQFLRADAQERSELGVSLEKLQGDRDGLLRRLELARRGSPDPQVAAVQLKIDRMKQRIDEAASSLETLKAASESRPPIPRPVFSGRVTDQSEFVTPLRELEIKRLGADIGALYRQLEEVEKQLPDSPLSELRGRLTENQAERDELHAATERELAKLDGEASTLHNELRVAQALSETERVQKILGQLDELGERRRSAREAYDAPRRELLDHYSVLQEQLEQARRQSPDPQVQGILQQIDAAKRGVDEARGSLQELQGLKAAPDPNLPSSPPEPRRSPMQEPEGRQAPQAPQPPGPTPAAGQGSGVETLKAPADPDSGIVYGQALDQNGGGLEDAQRDAADAGRTATVQASEAEVAGAQPPAAVEAAPAPEAPVLRDELADVHDPQDTLDADAGGPGLFAGTSDAVSVFSNWS